MNKNKPVKNISKGFTLIEMAIVMLIIGALISAAILPLGAQRDTNDLKKVREELKTIEQAIYGFAIANGRLPCPAQPGSATEAPAGGGDCTNAARGFVPANTLGISGNTNCDGLLVDAWGNPYRYSVSTSDVAGAGTVSSDFTTSGEINSIKTTVGFGLSALTPDLVVCDVDDCSSDLSSEAVAIIYSMGKNWRNITGVGETQNGDEDTVNSTCGLTAYGMSIDDDYVFHSPVETGAESFDDIVLWISENILYARLLAAGQL